MKNGLYLITTPIGNIGDMTKRAQEVLETMDYIYCEDTRNFKKLAQILGMSLGEKKLISFHDHSSKEQVDKIIELCENKKCALVSDAGSPIISDPALPLVKKAIEKNIYMTSIGGVSSVIVALELSGLSSIPFHFHGFLARDHSKKNKDFEMIGSIYGTHIFFEGVSRVDQTLSELSELYPNFEFALARELTKEFESVYHFKGEEYSQMKSTIVFKGEFVILISNPDKQSQQSSSKLVEMAQAIIDQGAKPKLLSKLLSEITGQASKDIYKELNTQK